MTGEQVLSDREIFQRAVVLTPAERSTYLNQACGDNVELRQEVESLLQAHDTAHSFMDQPAFQLSAAADGPTSGYQSVTEGPGTVIGPYKLLQQIGEGGMGVVFMAEQTHPIQRIVALKIIKPGMDTRQVIARFEAERQALAMMDHPNIARVLDAGTTDTGRPYFVMELVKGVPITRYCDEKYLPLNERLELFMQVCHAVQHAHQKGIIHRDVKPTNVLVAEYDNHAIPKVIDFGVAKATAQKLTERTMFTEFGQVLGTVEYMSPEQAKFNQLDIDTRTDIYSLGVLLYELLTGTTPFERKRLREAAFDEALRIIREEEPPKPSTKLSSSDTLPSVAANRHTEPDRLSKDVQGDLDWIVMKALEKDRNRRYQTASGFAVDIQHHLQDEPVLACPPTARYRIRKLVRKYRVPLAVTAGFALLLVAASVVSTWQAVRATRAEALSRANEAKARTEAAKATAVSNLLQEMFQSGPTTGPNPKAGPNYTVRQLLDDFSSRLGDQLKDQPEVELTISTTIGNTYRSLALTKQAEPHLAKSLELRRRLYGDDHVSVADALMTYAWNLRQGGDGAGAERYGREALAIYEKQNANPKVILSTYTTLLNFLLKQSKRADAEALAQKALEYARQHGQEQQVSGILQELATMKRTSGHPVEAEKLTREALALVRRLKKSPPPYLLLEHGTNLIALRKLDEAEPLLREALASFRERNFDEGHPSILDVKRRLVELLGKKGDSAGLTALRKDLVLSLSKGVQNQPDNTTLRIELGDLLWATGDVDGAFTQYSEAIAENPAQALAWKGRASCFAEKGDFANATDDYSKALKLTTVPGQRASIGHSLRISGFGRRGAGRFDEAEHYFRTSARIFEELRDQTPGNAMHWHFLADTHREVGLCLVGLKKPEEAEQEFRKAIEIHEQRVARKAPGDYVNDLEWSLAYLDLARLLIKTGRMQEAVPLVARGVEVNPADDGQPDELKAQIQLANLLREAGEFDQALATYSEVIDTQPTMADAWAGRGWLYDKRGEWDKSEADFAKVIELKPEHWEGWSGRAFSYLHRQQWEQAIADYTKAIELAPQVHMNWLHRGLVYLQLAQWDKAAADFSELIEQWPQDSGGWYSRAVAHAQLSRPNEALADLRQAVATGFKDAAQIKNDTRLDPLRSNEEFKKLLADLENRFRPALDTVKGAEFLRNTGKLDEAIKVCSEIVSREPDNDAAWRERANCYLRKGAYAKAAEDFTQVIKLKPGDAWAWHERGYCYLMLGQHAQAIVDHSKSIELQDHDWGQRLRRGHSYRALGELQKAESDYSRAIELNPTSWETWLARARVYAQQHKLERASTDLAHLIKLPLDAGAQNEIAWSLATDPDPSWRNPAVAVELAEKATAARPADGLIWNTFGAARYRNGQWNEAIAAFEKSMELRGGGDSNDWFFLAMCHWQLGNKQAARKWYDQAVVWMDKNQPSNGQLRGFRTEAEELLKITGEKPTTEPPVDVK